jgi:hypothetical protein
MLTVLLICGLLSCWRVIRHSLTDVLRTHCDYTWWQCILIHPQVYLKVFLERYYFLAKRSLLILTAAYLCVLTWMAATSL